MNDVIGWDIGGVNTKVARIRGGEIEAVRGCPYELQRDPAALVPLLRALAVEVGGDTTASHAVTMTAELSQMFRTKRDGVAFVLDAVTAAFPSALIRVFAVDGRLLAPEDARREPLAVAAANWSATAHAVARLHPDSVLIDIGTTTTDIIPIAGGVVVARGWTDRDRLASGELVYTGALRTPTEALASHVLLGGAAVDVSAEGFALAGDVHLWRGDLAPADYTVPTPDGRPATRPFAGERLARVVCADRDMLDEAAVSSIADALADAQLARITEKLGCVLARHPSLEVAVVTGLGAFLAAAAARRAGLRVVTLAAHLGEAAARCAPAAAVALLLEQAMTTTHPSPLPAERRADQPIITTDLRQSPSSLNRGDDRRVDQTAATTVGASAVAVVVKFGGGLLENPGRFEAVIAAIADASPQHRLLVVPGGGPFADAVRHVDRRFDLSDDAAHWMAVLAMDQYAYFVATKLVGAAVVTGPQQIAAAHAAGLVPVLAPYGWLRAADPLPHSWEVTSDSIAAWVAGQVGARRLVLIKPSGAEGLDVVDAYFSRALPDSVKPVIVAADGLDALHAAWGG